MIYETNKRDARGAAESARMDFSRPDAAGAGLNTVLWREAKGDAPASSSRSLSSVSGRKGTKGKASAGGLRIL